MKEIRKLYTKLPAEVRSKIRSFFPKTFLRWYAHRNIDVYLLSYPKCGRTWLRLMIGYAIAKHFNRPEDEEILLLKSNWSLPPSVPRIKVIHDDRPMLKAPNELEASKERYADKKVIFLARDPRDVIVSSYFEMAKRGHLFGKNPYEQQQPVFEGNLHEFINRSRGGFDTIIRYYNIWAENQHIPRNFLLIRYEDIQANPAKELRRVIDFLGLQVITDQTINEAVDYASFENMHKLEREGKFSAAILKPADRADSESYKTRQGKVGGFREYLNEETITDLNQRMQKLSPFYGYFDGA